MTSPSWPPLDHPRMSATLETLHLWTQVVGKVKLECLPWLNESWHVPLYVSARGLTTHLVTRGGGAFEMTFDLVAGALAIDGADGARVSVALEPRSVASFHAGTMAALREIGVDVEVDTLPSEIPDGIRFPDDVAPRVFELDAARSFWRALIEAQRVFHRFRSRFVGKCSPIHFFWGSFDLAVTRFSGRPAPAVTHGGPGFPAAVARDAYAGEQLSVGFWPGGGAVDGPSFYIEPWPAPASFATAAIGPDPARYVEAIGEWILPYDAVRRSDQPDATLLDFLQRGYAAVADAGGWDRASLERPEGPVGRPPPP